jgi:hypothetical protein
MHRPLKNTNTRSTTLPGDSYFNHDDVITECTRAGVPILKPTVHNSHGTYFTLLADPDGNVVEILGYPEEPTT